MKIDLLPVYRKKFGVSNYLLCRKIHDSKEMKHSEMTSARPLLSGLCLFCVGMLAASAHAASITFFGTESGAAVQNWSDDELAKTYDVNGTERYGNAGYYQIMPAAIGTDNVGLIADPSDNLGITKDISGAPAGTLQTSALTPGFLDGIPTGAAGDFLNNTNFPEFADSAGSVPLRQGALWLASPDEFAIEPSPDGIDGIRYNAFSFKLKEAAVFRLGIAVDGLGDGDFSVDFVTVTHVGSGEASSTRLTRDGVPDMVFFDMQGDPDDEFVVSLWEAKEGLTGARVASFSLITFDLTPDADPTLSYVLDGNNITLSWEPEISGWTLESSTDLGISDDWTAVTEPPVVNNSVTLDTTNAPKNYFRLRKEP